MIVVGCGKSKLDRPAPAAELYTGSLFRAARRYCEARGEPWVIASGKLGLVLPGEVVEPYDQRAPMSKSGAKRWARVCVECLLRVAGGPVFVELLAGKAYAEPLAVELWRAGCANAEPLARMGMGKRLSWLTRSAEALGVERVLGEIAERQA